MPSKLSKALQRVRLPWTDKGLKKRPTSPFSIHSKAGDGDEVAEAPLDQLCSKCEQLHVSKAKFLPYLGDDASGLPGALALDLDLLEVGHSSLGFLDEIYDQRVSCSFCWLIFSATYRETGTIGCDGLTDTSERVSCYFDWVGLPSYRLMLGFTDTIYLV